MIFLVISSKFFCIIPSVKTGGNSRFGGIGGGARLFGHSGVTSGDFSEQSALNRHDSGIYILLAGQLLYASCCSSIYPATHFFSSYFEIFFLIDNKILVQTSPCGEVWFEIWLKAHGKIEITRGAAECDFNFSVRFEGQISNHTSPQGYVCD